MRIDQLLIQNFKGFALRELKFHPEFNLIVGENGSGKTSVLDALSIAAGSWFLGLRGQDSRHIRADEDVRLAGVVIENSAITWEHQFPCVVEAKGEVLGRSISWRRSLAAAEKRTASRDARAIKDLAAETEALVRLGEPVVLPLISYYGTGRLWNTPREHAQVKDSAHFEDKAALSRFTGYRNSVDPRLSVSDLVAWIARQSWITFQQGGPSPTFVAVIAALVRCVRGAQNIFFDAKLGEVVIDFGEGDVQPFLNLSDGQRCMLAMVGDLAQKAAKLNPHFGAEALSKTPGVVLIDELDLHLHPRWQRHVIEDLRSTFPKLQFICTTHSPFLIQSLRAGEELVMLDGLPVASLAPLSIEQIAQGIQGTEEPGVERLEQDQLGLEEVVRWLQGVENPRTSARYEEMKNAARDYLETLELAAKAPKEKLAEYQAKLAEGLAPYADNPAFQAFLEMKRAAKLGS